MVVRIVTFLITALMLMAPARAAQSSLITPGSPLTMTGLATFLNNANATLGSNFSGSTPPATYSGSPVTYQFWMDSSTSPAILRMYDGAQWVPVGALDSTAHAFSVSALQIPTTSSAASASITDPQRGYALIYTNSSAAVSIGQAGSGGLFPAGWYVDVKNGGTGTVTITPSGSTINGLSSKPLTPGQSIRIVSDGTNYLTFEGRGTPTASSLGSVFSKTATTSQWLRSLGTDGIFTASQPSASDLTNGVSGGGNVVLSNSPGINSPQIFSSLLLRSNTSPFNNLAFQSNEALSADRALVISVADGSRTVTLGGDLTLGGSLSTAAAFTQAGAYSTTLTSTGITNSTLPAGTHTLAGLDVAQTWAAAQQFNDTTLQMKGSSSGTTQLRAAAAAGSGSFRFPAGSTDLSATGGTNYFLKQSSVGAAITSGIITQTELPGSVATGRRTTLTGATAIANSDCGSTLSLGGGANYTLTVAAVAGYDQGCRLDFINTDTLASKTLAVDGYSSRTLPPGQTTSYYNNTSGWVVDGTTYPGTAIATNIEWYGARTTNSGADNQTAIQAAINATPAGGQLVVPKTGYPLAGTLTVTSPITILCGGIGDPTVSANLTQTTTSSDTLVINSGYVTVRDCSFSLAGTPTGSARGIAIGTNAGSVTDGSFTLGSTNFNSASAPFTPSDVGKLAYGNFGVGGSPIFTTIVAYVNASNVTLAAAATCSPSCTGVRVGYGYGYGNITIDNVWTYNYITGIDIVAATTYSLNRVNSLGRSPLRIRNVIWADMGDGYVTNSAFSPTVAGAYDGVLYESGGGLKFLNNKIVSQAANTACFHITWAGVESVGPFLANNSIEGSCNAGILVDGVGALHSGIIANNEIASASGGSAIALAPTSSTLKNWVINGNTVRQTGAGSAIILSRMDNVNVGPNNCENADGSGLGLCYNISSTTSGSISVTATNVTNSIQNSSPNMVITNPVGLPFASLPSVAANGSQIFVTDGASGTSPCTGGGTGAMATRQNGAWSCGSIATGTGVLTALGVNVGTAGAFVVNGGALGTPASGTMTNVTGTAAGLTAGSVTTNANLTGPITSVGNTTSIASKTGTGTKFVVDTSPTLVTPEIGAATGSTLLLGGGGLGSVGEKITINGNTAAHIALRVANASASGYSTLWLGASNEGFIRYGASVGNKMQVVASVAGVPVTLATQAVDRVTVTDGYTQLSNHIANSGAAPALTSCGTSPSIIGSDMAGEVTMGTSATGCVITFNSAYSAAPYCTVTWQASPLASQSYSTSSTAITTIQTSTSNNKLNYQCTARSGG